MKEPKIYIPMIQFNHYNLQKQSNLITLDCNILKIEITKMLKYQKYIPNSFIIVYKKILEFTLQMQKLINIVNFSGWLFLVLHVGIQLFWDPKAYSSADITLDVNFLRFIQTFQIFDIILILIGKSKGSIIGAFFQILGRMIVAWGFVQTTSNPLRFATVAIIWSLADCNRYIYYLFKNHPLPAALRYNSFLILYPLGVFGQMLLINNFIQRHPELSQNLIYFIRFIQAGIVGGLLFLYAYMIKSRSNYYAKSGGFMNSFLKPSSEVEGERENLLSSEQRSRSPRAKRD